MLTDKKLIIKKPNHCRACGKPLNKNEEAYGHMTGRRYKCFCLNCYRKTKKSDIFVYQPSRPETWRHFHAKKMEGLWNKK